MNTYLRKKVRRQLDRMIAHVCDDDTPSGTSIAGMELVVDHDDGTDDVVTLLVIRGEWCDDLAVRCARIPDVLPQDWA